MNSASKKVPLYNRPMAWSILWGLALAWGVLGSIFSTHLQKSETYTTWWLNLLAFGYWILFLGMLVTVVFQKRQTVKERLEYENKLFSSLGQVQELIRTLPPDAFMFSLAAGFEVIVHSVIRTINIGKADLIEKQIRIVLLELISLAATFDEAEESEIYAANVMVYRATRTLSTYEQTQLIDRGALKFWQLPSLDGCQGVLWLDEALSTNSEDSEPTEDPNMPPFLALPIWAENGDPDSIAQLQPGAARAWWSRELMMAQSIDKFLEEAKDRNKYDVPLQIVHQMEQYFREGEGRQIGSFVSIPIMETSLEDPNPDEKCIAVLNIHRKSQDILRAEFCPTKRSPGQQFYYAISPYLTLLAMLIRAREEVYGRQRW